jgi:hypothetical protein
LTDSSDNIIWSVVDGEAMLLNVVSGDYFSLNETATEVWQHLHAGATEAEIVDAVARRYQVATADVQRDVAELMAELRSTKLLP